MTPTYYVFKMYKVHQEATMLPVEIKCNQYTLGTQSLDAVNCSASIKDGVVSITLCNLDPNKSQQVSFDLSGMKLSKVSGKIVTAGKINAYNDFGKKGGFGSRIRNVKIASGKVYATIPSKSVVMIQLQ